MSRRSARARRFTSVAAIVAGASVSTVAATSSMIGATTPPTTTVAATSAPTTAAPTTPTTTAPTTAAPTTSAPTTFPGPTPRASARVASPVDIEKIRATSLPFRTMGIVVGITILLLAITGFIYGKVRSRVPTVKVPKLATAGPAPAVQSQAPAPLSATPLPPPTPIPLPPPPVEDAVSDTVIFEPPPTHHAPQVIAQPEPERDDDAEPAEVVDSGETEVAAPDAEPGPDTTGRSEAPESPDRD